MSRITIHLKRAGDRIRDTTTTLSAPNTIFFKRERHYSTQFWDYPFDTPEPRLSADQTPPPPSPSTVDDVAERVSTASNHHDDPIHKPLPLVVARPKISDIQFV